MSVQHHHRLRRVRTVLKLSAALSLALGIASGTVFAQGFSNSTGGGLGQLTDPGVQIDPNDPLRLRFEGKSFLPSGLYGGAIHQTGVDLPASAPYLPPYPAPGSAFDKVLDKIIAHKLNYTRAWIHWGIGSGVPSAEWDSIQEHPYLRATESGRGVPKARDGGARFNLDAINPAWLNLIYNAVNRANNNHVVVQLALFDCYHLRAKPAVPDNQGPDITSDYYYGGNNVYGSNGQYSLNVQTAAQWTAAIEGTEVLRFQKQLVNAVLQKVGHFPNVVYETCNENNYDTNFDKVIGLLASSAGPVVSTAALPAPGPVVLPEHRQVPGHYAPGSNPNRPDLRDDLAELTAMRGELIAKAGEARPLITDNDCCSLDGFIGSEFVRQKAWAAFTAGAQTNYFHDRIGQMSRAGGLIHNADFQLALTQLGYLPEVIRNLNVNLVGMRAMDQHTAQAGDWVFGRSDEYFVYLPTGGSVVLPAAGQRSATWFNPRSSRTLMATPDAGQPNRYTPPANVAGEPAGSDWALLVRDGASTPIDHRLLVSYVPAPGAARQTATFDSAAPAPVHFHYDETLGNFEQRSGGACHNGYANPAYVELKYAGQGFQSCTLRTHLNAASTPCSDTVVQALNQGASFVLSTDDYAISPSLCVRAQPPQANVLPNQTAWWELDLVQSNGQHVVRRASMVKDTLSSPYLLLIGSYVASPGGAPQQVVSSIVNPPAVAFHYDPAQGVFEQRPGGRCMNGSNNPTYFKFRYHGDTFDSCTWRTSFAPAGTPAVACSDQLRNDLLSHTPIVIGTDRYQPVPNDTQCPPLFSTTPHMVPGDNHWIEVNLKKGNIVYPRRIAMRKLP